MFYAQEVAALSPAGTATRLDAATLKTLGGQPLSLEPRSVGWRGAAVAAMAAGAAPKEDVQLLALREPQDPNTNPLAADLLLFGAWALWEPRATALQGARATQEFKANWVDAGPLVGNMTAGPFDASQVVRWLRETNVETYIFLVCDFAVPNASSWALEYASFIDMLEYVTDNDVPIRMRLELLPPSEAGETHDNCLAPPDDPRTPFDDHGFFDPEQGYQDYVGGWGRLIGALAKRYPKLVSVNVDDLTPNVGPDGAGKAFTPATLATMTAEMRRETPWVSLVSTCYYRLGSDLPVAARYPDLPLLLDAPLFYFRNDKQGPGPCADGTVCPWGPRSPPGQMHTTGGCLAGACADPTVKNAPGEVADMVAWLPPGRELQVGFYATVHSTLGAPTANYTAQLMPILLGLDGVSGVVVYCMQVPEGPCDGGQAPLYGGDKGCVVKDAFGKAAAK